MTSILAVTDGAVLMNVTIAFISLLGTVFTGLMTYFMATLTKQAAVAAVSVKEVAGKTEEVRQTLEKTVKVANGKLDSIVGAQLRITALALRRLADISGLDTDKAAADLAEAALYEHHRVRGLQDTGNA